ncbi:MAG: C40 family peptidase [Lactobacillus sp.]|nr:C40 family peptidase [Lactobacillus sp.]
MEINKNLLKVSAATALAVTALVAQNTTVKADDASQSSSNPTTSQSTSSDAQSQSDQAAQTSQTSQDTTQVVSNKVIKKVRINYVPGYGINIWNTYKTGRKFTKVRAQHNTVWKVYQMVTYKGHKWYRVGTGKWIMAKYTKKYTQKGKKQASSTAAAVVTLLRAQLGKKYVWGATGPNSFDCSGLTSYVYSKAAGINITRTTYTQVNQGKRVSMSNLEPGDLLFWGSASAPYHVGIYIGGGQYIHAASPSQGVIQQSLSSYFYPSVAKRIL